MGETNYFINPLDQLRLLLTEAGIPYEDCKVEQPKAVKEYYRKIAILQIGPQDMNMWQRNQVFYGDVFNDKGEIVGCKFDAIYHHGADSTHKVIECWGSLIGEEPKCLTPQGAFEVIKADWEKCKGEKDEGDA